MADTREIAKDITIAAIEKMAVRYANTRTPEAHAMFADDVAKFYSRVLEEVEKPTDQ